MDALLPTTMRAVRFARHGPPDCLELHPDVRVPSPAPNEVLVRVRASGVNPIDWQLASGQYRWIVPTCRPAIPGFDLCGEVAAVGTDVSAFEVGERVCGLTRRYGACADYALVAEDALVHAPTSMTNDEAAAMPLAGSTALQCLRDHGGLTTHSSTQRVLIVGASGGVGHYAVQIARAAGAHVAAVCSAANAAWVRDLGAHEAFDYQKTNDFGSGYHIVLDAIGALGFSHLRRALAPSGRYVAPNPGATELWWTLWTRVTGSRACNAMLFRSDRDDLATLAALADAGNLRSEVAQTFPLAELSSAHRASMAGRVRGKLVITMSMSGSVVPRSSHTARGLK